MASWSSEPLVGRLRVRLDEARDERDDALRLLDQALLENSVLRRRIEAHRDERSTANQHGRHPAVYPTEAERAEARRMTWRESKRRARTTA